MTVQELYERIGGDYAGALGRLFMDKLVAQFVVKFLDDTSCRDLFSAWEAHDEKAAFEAAHRAKGVCGNLSLTRLAELTTQICEALRPGNDELRASTDVDSLVNELKQQHAVAMAQISAFAAQN